MSEWDLHTYDNKFLFFYFLLKELTIKIILLMSLILDLYKYKMIIGEFYLDIDRKNTANITGSSFNSQVLNQ